MNCYSVMINVSHFFNGKNCANTVRPQYTTTLEYFEFNIPFFIFYLMRKKFMLCRVLTRRKCLVISRLAKNTLRLLELARVETSHTYPHLPHSCLKQSPAPQSVCRFCSAHNPRYNSVNVQGFFNIILM